MSAVESTEVYCFQRNWHKVISLKLGKKWKRRRLNWRLGWKEAT